MPFHGNVLSEEFPKEIADFTVAGRTVSGPLDPSLFGKISADNVT